jgi:hypothetical protein
MLRHGSVLVCLLLAACQRDQTATPGPSQIGPNADRSALGRERNDCRADKTCDPGLLCLSNLCVKPPPADCTVVAETFASFELGNYADPEERAPLVSKFKAECEKVYVTKEEGKCLDDARDKWSAAQCVPRMFPELAAKSTTGDCAQVAASFRTSIAQQMPQTDPQTKAMVDAMIGAIHASCDEDQWPGVVVQCYLASNSMDAIQKCDSATPPALKQKIQNRVMAAMQTLQR